MTWPTAEARARRPGVRAASTWLGTLAATAASTYALDAAVASQLLSGLDNLAVLALLGATYLLWGLGLRANLRANWLLLQRIGTSTAGRRAQHQGTLDRDLREQHRPHRDATGRARLCAHHP